LLLPLLEPWLAPWLAPDAPVLPPERPYLVLAVIGGLALALAGLASRAGRPAGTGPFVALSLATAAALVADVTQGAPLIKSSLLGYDPITGARFYGIGNEYMGVLIGTTLVGATGLLDRFPRRSWLRWAI